MPVSNAYFSQGKNITKAQRCFCKKIKIRSAPTTAVFRRSLKNFTSTGNIRKRKSPQKPIINTAIENQGDSRRKQKTPLQNTSLGKCLPQLYTEATEKNRHQNGFRPKKEMPSLSHFL